jgi:hypothetical protein
MAAMFDLSVTPTWKSVRTSPTALLDPDNKGIALGILLLTCIEAKMYVISYLYLRLMVTIFNFQHTQTSGSLRSSLVVLPDPKTWV